MRTTTKEVPQEGFYFDEKRHLYFLDGKPMTGCTTILGVLAKPALIQWAAKMACEHIRDTGIDYTIDGIPYILTQGHLIEEARTAHARKRDEAADKGTDTHALVEEWVKQCIESGTMEGTIVNAAIKPFAEWAIKNNIRFIASEQKVYSKELFVAGTFDLLFEKDGKRYIGDIKTYKKIWDRVPLIQCAGYALMWEEMHLEMKGGWPNGVELHQPQPIDGYCIINLPKEREFDESADVMWSHDPVEYREAFQACVRLYRVLNAN